MIFDKHPPERHGRIPLDELKHQLAERAEDLARTLRHERPANPRSHDWRWGSSGSESYIVRSRGTLRRGTYSNFEAGIEGGSSLDFIMVARGCAHLRDAIDWATAWLGLDTGASYAEIPPHVLEERARARAEQDAKAEAHRQQRTETANYIWDAGVDPIGTLGTLYLAGRAIDLPDQPPPCIRWHHASGALVFGATTENGAIQSVQRIYIGQNAKKLEQPELDRRRLPAAKVTTGPVDGAAVRLPAKVLHRATPGPLLLAEGPETGLSCWQATGHETWIALGQISKLTPPTGRLVILCRDDDKPKKPGQPGPSAEDRHRKLIAELRGRGLQIATALPWPERRFDSSDFNDVLCAGGNAAVAAQIAAVTPPDLPPEFTPPTHTLNEARAALLPKVSGFYRAAVDANAKIDAFLARQKSAKQELRGLEASAGTLEEPTEWQRERLAELREIMNAIPPAAPHHGLKVGLGIGKTHAAAEEIATYLAEARAVAVTSGIIWTAPTLELADQTAAMLAGNGVSVGVYRGRRAPDPDAEVQPKGVNDDTGRMCLDLAAVRLAHDAGANVAETVCGNEKGEDHERCPHYAACPFQLNNKTLRDRDVVVAAHNALLQELPAKVEKNRGLTVIDEAFWQSGLSTSELATAHLVADLDDAPVRGKDGPDYFATDVLASTMSALQSALEAHDDATPISATVLRFWGLEAGQCRGSAREQWRRMIPLEMRPGMPLEDRRAASRSAHTNRRVPAMARLLQIVADILDGLENARGRLEMTAAALKAGSERRVVLHHCKGLVKARLGRPILHLDATMPVAAVRQYLPALDVVAEIDATAPHMKLIQVLSTRENRGGWGKNSVVPDQAPDEEEQARREGRLAQLRDFVGLMRSRLGNGLVVTYAAIEDRFAAMEGVKTGHFNALAGLNGFERVSFATVIGRPMPDPRATAEIVKQLFGRWVDASNPAETFAGLVMADGSRRTITTRRHVNPDMEAVRRAIADDNVTQAIGRVRAVRRTSESPVTVLLLSDVVTPFPLAAVLDWPTLALDRVQRMAARGVLLESPTDAARAYPDLFSSSEAARRAFKEDRRSTGQSPRYISILGIRPVDQAAVSVRYRPVPTPQEPKPKTRIAGLTDPARLPGLREWLEALVGRLALFEVVEVEVEPRSEEPPAAMPEDDVSDSESDRIEPDRMMRRAEVPFRAGADLRLHVVMPDGSFRPIRPRPPPQAVPDPDPPPPWRAVPDD